MERERSGDGARGRGTRRKERSDRARETRRPSEADGGSGTGDGVHESRRSERERGRDVGAYEVVEGRLAGLRRGPGGTPSTPALASSSGATGVTEDLGEEEGGRPFGLAGRGAEPFDLDLVRAVALEMDLVEGGTEAWLWTAGEGLRKESATPPSQERALVEKN